MDSNNLTQRVSNTSDGDDYMLSLPPIVQTQTSKDTPLSQLSPQSPMRMVRSSPFLEHSRDIENQVETTSTVPVNVPTAPVETKRSHFKKYKHLYMLLFILLAISAVVVPVTIIQLRDKNNNHNNELPREEIVIPDNFTTLEFSFNNGNWMNDSNWNYTKIVYGNDTVQVIDNNTLVVKYPQGSYSPSSEIEGGFSFYMSPKNMNLTDEVYFSYKVKFGNNNFNWVRGGMLPGIWIGRMGAFGGVFLEDGASMRVMWRSQGFAEAYVYVPPVQDSDYYKLPGYVKNEGFGDSLGRGLLRFNQEEWNDIVMHVKLNTPGNFDGILELTINGLLLKYEKMNWRNGSEPISGFMMQSFFGGADQSWATPVDQEISFKDFKVFV